VPYYVNRLQMRGISAFVIVTYGSYASLIRGQHSMDHGQVTFGVLENHNVAAQELFPTVGTDQQDISYLEGRTHAGAAAKYPYQSSAKSHHDSQMANCH
jgi:hypothetical protein